MKAFSMPSGRSRCRSYLVYMVANMRKISIALFLGLASLGIGTAVSNAADVLGNGNFETGVGIPNWTLTTSVAGVPGSTSPSLVEQSSNAAYPTFNTGLGLFVKPA